MSLMAAGRGLRSSLRGIERYPEKKGSGRYARGRIAISTTVCRIGWPQERGHIAGGTTLRRVCIEAAGRKKVALAGIQVGVVEGRAGCSTSSRSSDIPV